MRVALSATADNELVEIFRYNAEHRGEPLAIRYEDFLVRSINSLATEHAAGKAVSGYPDLRRMTFKMNPRGDGHIAIYRIDEAEKTIIVVHIFHTKMDLDTRLRDD